MTDTAQLPALTQPTSSAAEERAKQLVSALLDAARERGYAIGHGRMHPGHWKFVIQGADVEWLVYERSAQRKVPLTKKEKKDWLFSHIAERGWKRVLVPSGWLVLLVSGDYQSQQRIEEKPRFPLVASDILARFEQMGAYGAAERQRRREEERLRAKRATERLRSRRVEDSRWNAMNDMIAAAEQAQRLRRFIDIIATRTPLRPDQERRVRKFVRWARTHADAIDPMTKDFDIVLARLGLHKR
ncbi:MAG TPA: hypothetical protein VII56_12820 [Rhizomicrobium sp.]